MAIGISTLISRAGFFRGQTVPSSKVGRRAVVYRETKRKGKSLELVLTCRATLTQTHIKAFGHQTSLVQRSGEYFHFKLHDIFQGNFFFLCHIYTHTHI